MSQAHSPSTDKPYGVTRVASVWQIARSSFYFSKARQNRVEPSGKRRGPKTKYSDAELTDHIRQVIRESPFHGEGHRKIWARLRGREIRSSKPRVLRLMREAQLLGPARQPAMVASHPHAGTIITEQPNQVWGTDATASVTVNDGQVTVFAAIDHCTAECLGIHVVKRATRFEALEPIRQAVKEVFGGFRANVAQSLKLRHDHGSQYMSDDFQKEIRFLGLESSPAFVRQPEGNGCIERFFRTLKEQLLWVQHFDTIEELRQELLAFKETYNQNWLIERLGFKSPRQAREDLLALGVAA